MTEPASYTQEERIQSLWDMRRFLHSTAWRILSEKLGTERGRALATMRTAVACGDIQKAQKNEMRAATIDWLEERIKEITGKGEEALEKSKSPQTDTDDRDTSST